MRLPHHLACLISLSVAGTVAADKTGSHWAFQPLSHPALPQVDDTSWPTSPIDHFILAQAESQNLSPAPPASPLSLFRRLHFDLTGLPPSRQATADFTALPSATRHEKIAGLIDGLLASPHYGERWGRHWLDVARYADTAGETADFPTPQAWRYRNYVIDAFNSDKPFDQFVREQLAGDILASAPDTTPGQFAELTVATGYIAIARRFGFDILADHHLTIEDTIDTVGRSVLGLSLSCARCHDHPFDPVSADDYYGLYGIFDSTRFPFPGCEKDKMPSGLVPLAKPPPPPDGAAITGLTASQDKQSEKIKTLSAENHKTLDDQLVDQGHGKPFHIDNVRVRPGDAIQLSVHPRDNYGADTTRIEFTVTTTTGSGQTWDARADVLAGITDPAPGSATWHLLDVRDGPRYLSRQVADHDNHPGLHLWRPPTTDQPSVFANTTGTDIAAWTTLTAKSLFAHPAPDGPAAITWLSPVDSTVTISGLVADAHPGHGDGVRFVIEHFTTDLTADFATLATISAELDLAHTEHQRATALAGTAPVAYAVTEGDPHDAAVHLRGDPKNHGPSVPRKNLDLLGGQFITNKATSGRLELARWLTAPDNPLTPRVIANRVWQHHFGHGIVATPDDFGTRGALPSHPGLLDWLAAELVSHNWSIKHLHRLILNSATYRQSSAPSDPSRAALSRTLFACVPRRRLGAEEIRDSLLAVSGNLDTTPAEGHPFPPPDTWGFTQHNPFIADYPHRKRSVYLMAQRIRQHPFLALFDGADTNSTTGQRGTTTVPTQTLFFMNNPFVRTQADALAAALTNLPETRDRITHAIQSTYARDPSPGDIEQARSFLEAYTAALPDQPPTDQFPAAAWQAWCRVLLSSNEFLYVD